MIVRETLKSLRDKSIIMMLQNGTETSVSCIQKFWVNKGSGKVKIRFDEDIAPYLFDISGSTTRFELLNILPMKSKYSIRIYEICRSWAKLRHKIYMIEELRNLLMVSDNELIRFLDFRRKVLEVAQKEIVKNTDLYIYYEYITKGRKVIKVHIFIKEKSKEMKEIIENKYCIR